MTAPDWLTARPIAHRGFHDASARRIENSLSAVNAAMEHGFSIEIDVSPAGDGTPMVFHDDLLDRLTDRKGAIKDFSAAELSAIRLRGSDDRIPTLAGVLEHVNGRAGLVIEIKSDFKSNPDYVPRILDVLNAYDGPFVVMSFDPEIVADIRNRAPHVPRGIVSGPMDPRIPYWRRFTLMERFILRHLLHAPRSRPDFIAYDVDGLPALSTLIARGFFKRPILTWTVRTNKDRTVAGRWADQMIFEGFDPEDA